MSKPPSPVVGTILMVAITVILAAVISVFMLRMAGSIVINSIPYEPLVTPTNQSILTPTPSDKWNEPPHYEKIIVTDKSISSSKSSQPTYTIFSGNKAYPIPKSAWEYQWYNRIELGKAYIIMLQGNELIRVYTLQEAYEFCDLRPYVNGTRCSSEV